MIELNGKYNSCKVFTDNIDNETISQLINFMNQEYSKDSKIRIMSDCHAGAGCVIGTTMTITDKVCANLVGVDISCGVSCTKYDISDVNFKQLDDTIRTVVPSGFDIHSTNHPYVKENNLEFKLSQLYCYDSINIDRALKSIGTLGGGNHFIELNKTENNKIYLVIHTGSRNLGKQVAEYYQKLAIQNLKHPDMHQIVTQLKAEGREKEIELVFKQYKNNIPDDLAYMTGDLLNQYLHDIKILQEYANINREAIRYSIEKAMNWEYLRLDEFQSVHNYIDVDNMILRKGAIAAYEGQKCIIPINMRDGSLICIGKGNPEWNYSAPHGAGRVLSRSAAKSSVPLENFIETMTNAGIYSTSVGLDTLDESPFAYKPLEEIKTNIQDTVEIIEHITPIYNFKASEKHKALEKDKNIEDMER